MVRQDGLPQMRLSLAIETRHATREMSKLQIEFYQLTEWLIENHYAEQLILNFRGFRKLQHAL